MATEYKVITDWLCLTAGHKGRKIERYFNDFCAKGWEFVALESVTVLGFDIGFYLVL